MQTESLTRLNKTNSIRSWLSFAWSLTFARYLVVGTANTLFSYLVYAVALLAGANYQVASLISLVAGILLSFKTQGTFVFRNQRKSLFGRYVIVWSVIYAGNIGFIAAFMHLHANTFEAGAMALPFNVLLGFALQRFFVFGGTVAEKTPGE